MAANNKTIFYADDDQSILMGMSIVIERLGYGVIPVENGQEVLRLLKIFTPDVIVLDMNMPELDGLETLKQIKKNEDYSHIPVIMVSGDSGGEKMQECRNLGCHDYLVKPLEINALHDALEKCTFPQGRRKGLRADLDAKVSVKHNGRSQILFTKSLSEKGVFIRTGRPLPVGSEVEVTMLVEDESLTLQGTVVYLNTIENNPASFRSGMAIEFKDIPVKDSVRLKVYVSKLIVDGVSEYGKDFLRIDDSGK